MTTPESKIMTETTTNPVQSIMKTYVLPVLVWAMAAMGTVHFASQEVLNRLDRIETNIQKVSDEQESQREDLEKMKKDNKNGN